MGSATLPTLLSAASSVEHADDHAQPARQLQRAEKRLVNRGAAVECVLINGRVAFQHGEFVSDLGQPRGFGQFLRAGATG